MSHFVANRWPRPLSVPTRFVELGSHSGIISVLLTSLMPQSSGLGVELIARQVELMQRNIRLNRLTDRLIAMQGDIRELAEQPQSALESAWGSYDFVVCNPPYGVPGRGLPPCPAGAYGYEKQVAREEVRCNFQDI